MQKTIVIAPPLDSLAQNTPHFVLTGPLFQLLSTKNPSFVLNTDKKDRHAEFWGVLCASLCKTIHKAQNRHCHAEFHAILRMRVIKKYLPRLLRISVEDLDYNQKTPLSEGNTKLKAEVVDSVKVVGLVGVRCIAIIDSQLESEVSLREREP